jgi:hypothetical protein
VNRFAHQLEHSLVVVLGGVGEDDDHIVLAAHCGSSVEEWEIVERLDPLVVRICLALVDLLVPVVDDRREGSVEASAASIPELRPWCQQPSIAPSVSVSCRICSFLSPS